MKVILALVAAGFILSLGVTGLTPIAPSTSAEARHCSKEKCRSRCRARCITSMCDTCDKP
jgi:hypothetical protein